MQGTATKLLLAYNQLISFYSIAWAGTEKTAMRRKDMRGNFLIIPSVARAE